MSHRIKKVNEVIKQSVSDIIAKELSLKKGVFVTISKIDTSKDLRYTRIFVSIFPNKETGYALTTLKKELFTIQKNLNKKLQMKIVPRIDFIPDETQEKVDGLEEIFKKIKEEN